MTSNKPKGGKYGMVPGYYKASDKWNEIKQEIEGRGVPANTIDSLRQKYHGILTEKEIDDVINGAIGGSLGGEQ